MGLRRRSVQQSVLPSVRSNDARYFRPPARLCGYLARVQIALLVARGQLAGASVSSPLVIGNTVSEIVNAALQPEAA